MSSMAILIDNPTSTLIEHPEDLRTEVANRDEMCCRDFFDDVWARGNDERVTDYLDDHFVWNSPPGYDNNRDGYAKMVRDVHHAFPDLYADVDEVVAGDGKVAARWIMEGHHQNEWMGIKPSGKAIRMEGLIMDHMKDGRIVKELSLSSDMQSFAQGGTTARNEPHGPGANPNASHSAEAEAPSMWDRFKRALS